MKYSYFTARVKNQLLSPQWLVLGIATSRRSASLRCRGVEASRNREAGVTMENAPAMLMPDGRQRHQFGLGGDVAASHHGEDIGLLLLPVAVARPHRSGGVMPTRLVRWLHRAVAAVLEEVAMRIRVFGGIVRAVTGLLIAVVLSGCPAAGAGGGGGGNEDLPSGYGYMWLTDKADASVPGEPTHVRIATAKDVLLNEAPGDFVQFTLYDSTESWEVESGTYIFDPTNVVLAPGDPGTISEDELVFALGQQAGETGYDRAGTPAAPADVFGSNPPPDWYEQITVAEVEVSVSSAEYTFSWTFTTADGDTISGSYSGIPDDVTDGGLAITSADHAAK